MKTNNPPSTTPSEEDICLGIVIITDFNKAPLAQEQLKQFTELELGEAQGTRLPGCLVTARGNDRTIIAAIEALSSVLKVEVAYAQVLDLEEEVEEKVS